MQILRLAALALVLGGLAVSASAQTVINADVITNTTWGPGEVVLDRPIFVRGATLTIQPGTVVRGQPRTAAVSTVSTVGSPGGLIITQTGRLIANGNALQPIIFTTAATDNNNDGVGDNVDLPANAFLDPWNAGDVFLDDTPATAPLAPLNKAGAPNVSLWGGLVILGNAPTNLADLANVGYGRGTVEGLVLPGTPAVDATYGGEEPHDSSGSLRFVSVRHAGDELGAGNELNGITLAGVGDGTVFENIEVYCNFDDGIEWFGGTVNGKNLATFFIGDDNFDMDQGYTGLNQFMFAIMPFFNAAGGASFGSASGDKAGELDGDDYRPDDVAFWNNINVRNDITGAVIDGTPWPLSSANLYNLTVIGSTPDVANPALPLGITAASANRGVQMRNGFAGNLASSIVVNTGTARGIELVLVVPPDEDSVAGFDVVDNANNGLISVYCSTFQNTGAIANPSAEQTAIDNGNNAFAASGDNNVVNLATFNGLQNESTYFDPTGNAAGKLDPSLKATPINPRPNSGLTGTVGCTAPQGPGLSAVSYRGAFERVAPTLWTTDWTSLSIGGLLAD
jgi:hypothetical protein